MSIPLLSAAKKVHPPNQPGKKVHLPNVNRIYLNLDVNIRLIKEVSNTLQGTLLNIQKTPMITHLMLIKTYLLYLLGV